MKGKVLLLTGIPATGKTTLASTLKNTVQPLYIISFGKLIVEIAKQDNPDATYNEIRSNPTQQAKTDRISKAIKLLLKNIREYRETSNVIIDSHAVAIDSYGFRVTPDSYSILNQIKLDAIIVLHAPHAEIASRIATNPEGRRLVTKSDIALHESLQDSVSIAYGVASGCPVFILNTYKSKQELLEKTLAIFASIGMAYTKVTTKSTEE